MGNVLFNSKVNRMKVGSCGMSPWACEDPREVPETGHSPPPPMKLFHSLHQQRGPQGAGPGPSTSSLVQLQHSCSSYFHFHLL